MFNLARAAAPLTQLATGAYSMGDGLLQGVGASAALCARYCCWQCQQVSNPSVWVADADRQADLWCQYCRSMYPCLSIQQFTNESRQHVTLLL